MSIKNCISLHQYIRVSNDVKAQELLRLLTKQWGVEHPKLLIEVTGGAKNFVMQPKLRRIFRHGIIKAATSTNAWILTGGTNTGQGSCVLTSLVDQVTKTMILYNEECTFPFIKSLLCQKAHHFKILF